MTTGFFDAAFPAPGSPQHTPWRIISSATLLLFLVSVSYLALTSSSTGDTVQGWRTDGGVGDWIWMRTVTWTGSVSSQLAPGPAMWPEGVDLPIEGDEEDEGDEGDGEYAGAEVDIEAAHSTDLNQYVWHRDCPYSPSTAKGRLIIVGDIHGMIESFRTLLEELRYEQGVDTLILVGDLVAKAPSIKDSLAVVSHARQIGAHTTRGNHDQRVVSFRIWQDLNALSPASEDEDGTLEGESWMDADEEPSDLRTKLPKGWKWRSQHFEIARRLPRKDFHYLLDRSLTLHIRSLHTYVVHAGLLPESIPRSSTSPSDTLDQHADLTSTSPSLFNPSDPDLLTSDDAILLRRQNRRPNTLLEMRGVTKHGTRPHSNGKKGTPWPTLWDETMSKCDEKGGEDCRALGVVYGHWAARGLSVGSHAVGLDSGCVYGRSLSALIVLPDERVEEEVKKSDKLERVAQARIGGRDGTVYSVKCKKP